jgi:hypothetical protein
MTQKKRTTGRDPRTADVELWTGVLNFGLGQVPSRCPHVLTTPAAGPTRPLMASTRPPRPYGTPPKIRRPMPVRAMSREHLYSTGPILRQESKWDVVDKLSKKPTNQTTVGLDLESHRRMELPALARLFSAEQSRIWQCHIISDQR